jgi:hypothetical protein
VKCNPEEIAQGPFHVWRLQFDSRPDKALAGIVHQHVDFSELPDDKVHEGIYLHWVGGVSRDGQYFRTERLQFALGFAQKTFVASANRKLCAAAGELSGGDQAEALPTAGDDDDASA